MLILKLYENYKDLAEDKPSCVFNDVVDVNKSTVGGWSFVRFDDLKLVLPSTTIFTLQDEDTE